MLKDTISSDLREAMRAKDRSRLSALRMIQSAIIEQDKSGEGAATEEDIIAILQKQAKKRRESIEQFEDAGRDDLVEKEKAELEVVEGYLPAQASDDEIRGVVQEVIESVDATSKQDIGRVMGPSMGQLKGKADGNRVRALVEEQLESLG